MQENIFVGMMREAAKAKLRAAKKELDRHAFCQNEELYRSVVNIAEAEYAFWNRTAKYYIVCFSAGEEET